MYFRSWGLLPLSPLSPTSKLREPYVHSTTLCVVLLRQPIHSSLQRHLNSASPDFVNCYLSETVPCRRLCVFLLRKPLRTLLQHREIHTSSENFINSTQNPLVGFFNVDFNFLVFFRMHALGIQMKIFYGLLLSLATAALRYGLIMLAYQFTVEYLSGCNRFSLLGV